MDRIPSFQTKRLLLTPLVEADIPVIQQLFPHWDVVRYLDSRVPWPYPDDGAEQYVHEHVLPAVRLGKEWHWMIRLAEKKEPCSVTESRFDSSLAFTPFDLDGDAAGAPVVINPDDYLETEFGREFTPERSRQAWTLAYERLSAELAQPKDGVHVYLVMGVQGAGKSRWVSENLGRLGPRAVVFDAALPARRHRERLLEITRAHGAPVIAIFVKAALDLALSRNASRSADKRVPEDAVRSVFGMLEAPVVEEGFVWVHEVDPLASLP